MMALMPTLFRRLGLATLAGLALTVLAAAWAILPARHALRLVSGARLAATPLTYFLIGFAAAAAIAWWRRRGERVEYAATFGHELAHMLVALVLGYRVHEFRASLGDGGHVRHVGPASAGLRSTLISVAPYAIPMTALAAAGLAAIVGACGPPARVWAGAIGVGVGIHVAIAVHHALVNLRASGDTDFRQVGHLRAFAWIWTLNAVLLAALLAYAAGGSPGIRSLGAAVWQDTVELARSVSRL
jgi:hypothetical protein